MDNNLVSVVKGNDFILDLYVSKYDKDQGKQVPYDVSEATDVVLRLIGNNGFVKVIRDAQPNGFKITANVDGRLRDGKYGVELLFKINNMDKRIYQANKIEILNCNCCVDAGAQTTQTIPTYDLSMYIGVDVEKINFGAVTYGNIDIDSVLSETSTNPVMNKTVTAALKEAGKIDDVLVNGESVVEDKVAEIIMPTKVSDLDNDAGYLTEHQSLTDYAKISDVDSSLDLKADKTSIPTKVSELDNDAGYLTEHQSLTDYAKISDVDSSLALKAEKSHKHKMADITDYTAPDLSPYALKETVEDNYQYAEDTYTKKEDSEVTDVSVRLLKSSVDSLYTELSKVSTTANRADTNAKNIEDILLPKKIDKGGIKTINGQSLEGTGNIEIKSGSDPVDLSDYAKISDVDASLALKADKTSIPTIPSFKTINGEEITGTGNIEIKSGSDPVDLSDYAKISDVDSSLDLKADKTSIPTVPTKVSAFTNDAGYLTEHQSLSDYAKKTDIPDTTNFATKDEIPTVPSFKTINGEEITGIGNIEIKSGGSDGSDYTAGEGIDITDNVISSAFFKKGTGEKSIQIIDASNQASGLYSLALGYNTKASGQYSHAEGTSTKASGASSHAEGHATTAFDYSHAECYGTKASGQYSHAEGNSTTASGNGSHAEGYSTTAEGNNSHAEGSVTRAQGNNSHAEGYSTRAQGDYSHAEGNWTTATGYYSHAEGNYTTASNTSEHASGQYNISNKASGTFGDAGNTLFSVGNGKNAQNKHNAFEIRQNGDIYIADSSMGEPYKLQDRLNNYATKSEINSKQDTLVSGTTIKTVNGESILGEGNITIEDDSVDLTDYAKISDVDASLDLKADKTSIPTIPTKVSAFTNDAGYLTEHQSLTAYAKITDVDASLDLKADKAYVEELATELEDKASKTFVASNYQPIGNYITTIPAEYVTETELEGKGYLTEHQSLSDYAKISDVDVSLNLKADKTSIPTKVSAFTNDAGYLTEHQSLTDYAKKTDVDASLNLKADKTSIPTKVSAFTNDALYIKEFRLFDYYTKTEIDNMIGDINNILNEI